MQWRRRVTCPARLGPCLVDDLDVTSFAVVVGGEADGAADGTDVIGSRTVDEGHAVGADERGVDVDRERLFLCRELVLLV